MATVSRRQFLHQSLAAGAAVGACPRIARADAPNSKLGVAVVGVRGRGQYLLSAFLADPRTRVAAIVEARRILADVNSLDDNLATLDRTARHLADNGVDLKKEPLSIGPLLKFDPQREVFPDSHQATALTTREYREGFLCPTPDAV
jgi:hypothetical protein